MLTLYRSGLALRRDLPELGAGTLTWDEPGTRPQMGEHVVAFRRGDGFLSVTNLGRQPVALPAHREILLASERLEGGRLPADTTAWLRLG